MRKVGIYEAKTHLPKLIDEVMHGASIVITKHGVPVAILEPHETVKRSDPATIIAQLRDFRKKHTLEGLSIREMIAEGRR
jgi:prevent-host-death family protein